MHSVEISFLNSDCLLTSSLYKTPAFVGPIGTKIGDLVQYMTVRQLSFPMVSSVSALFYAGRIPYCIARPCYGFLSILPSVHPSVSHKVCPRRRAVSLRQLSFLFYALQYFGAPGGLPAPKFTSLGDDVWQVPLCHAAKFRPILQTPPGDTCCQSWSISLMA